MKLERQVCSLELSQSLKNLNVEHESAFTWVESHFVGDTRDYFENRSWTLRYGRPQFDLDERPLRADHLVSAFTVA